MTDSDHHLRALYPHLADHHAGTVAAGDLARSAIAKADESCRIKAQFFAESANLLVETAQSMAALFARGGRLFTMGNGGSSCDAAHFAVEFGHPVTAGRPALPVMHLADDTALLTAIANDVGFAHAYRRRLDVLARPGDGLVAFSTSGNSDNLSAALLAAGELGLARYALLGGDGGEILRLRQADHVLCVNSDSIHRVQETHVAIYHVLWDLVHTQMASSRSAVTT